MIGERFGLLVVAESSMEPASNRAAQVVARCDCGEVRRVRISDLERGAIKSCGGDAHRVLEPQECVGYRKHRGTSKTYAILAEGVGMVKIGKAFDLDERLHDLQTGSPVQLRMIAFTEEDIEAELHELLALHRSHREWFRHTDEVAEALAARMQTTDRLAPMGIAGNRKAVGSKCRCKACGELGHFAKTCKKAFSVAAEG